MMGDELLEKVVGWFLEHVAWGHLDDIPDETLTLLLKSPDLSMAIAASLVSSAQCKVRDNPEELWVPRFIQADQLNRAMSKLRRWLVVEKLRRMGKLTILNDMLLTELIAKEVDCLGDSAGNPLNGEFAETEAGKVRFVGREIDLCKA